MSVKTESLDEKTLRSNQRYIISIKWNYLKWNKIMLHC